MEITWLGHAAFHLRSGNSALLMDPFPPDLGLRISSSFTRASVVTVSNSDPNHSAVDTVSDEAKVLKGPGEYEVANLQIKGLRTRLNPLQSEVAAWNTVFVLEMEGVSICHLGRLAAPLSTKQVEELESPQVLLLPVGGHGLLSPTDAAELANAIEPRIVVPMLYAHAGNNVELEPLSRFMQELGIKQPEEQPRLSVTRTSLPGEMEVAVLQPTGTLI